MKANKLIMTLAVLSIAATALFYGRLPDEIVLHFNVRGEADRWGDRNVIWILSSLPLLIYLLMMAVPRIEPRKESYEKHMRGYTVLANSMVLFLIGLNWFTILFSIGYALNIQMYVLTTLGALFIVLGNHLPNARQNYTFGIRTPWTLCCAESWTRTHRVGGIAFILTGLVSVASAFIPGPAAFIIFVSTLFLMIIGLFLYSYRVYRKTLS